jgi:hypothetical protein
MAATPCRNVTPRIFKRPLFRFSNISVVTNFAHPAKVLPGRQRAITHSRLTVPP